MIGTSEKSFLASPNSPSNDGSVHRSTAIFNRESRLGVTSILNSCLPRKIKSDNYRVLEPLLLDFIPVE